MGGFGVCINRHNWRNSRWTLRNFKQTTYDISTKVCAANLKIIKIDIFLFFFIDPFLVKLLITPIIRTYTVLVQVHIFSVNHLRNSRNDYLS